VLEPQSSKNSAESVFWKIYALRLSWRKDISPEKRRGIVFWKIRSGKFMGWRSIGIAPLLSLTPVTTFSRSKFFCPALEMTSESPLAQITCPQCHVLSAPDNDYCGYCGAALNYLNRHRDYESAVGSAILALTRLESEVFNLLDILGVKHATKAGKKVINRGNPLPLEGASFSEKMDTLEDIACRQIDATLQAKIDATLQTKLQKIVSQARVLGDDRNNFAHGLLWIDAFTGEHKRTFVRRGESKGTDDPRPPELIEHVAFELNDLAGKVRELAMDLGGLERWEKFYEEYLAPTLAHPDKPSGP
jgi:hypothetical protein